MLQKFATQIDAEVLEQFRALAANQGRKLQAVIGEALSQYLQTQQNQAIRPQVLQTFRQNQAQFGDVYSALTRHHLR
ncbi:MAG: hypothetical protein EBR79_03500 [Proteobacteria bacterium]|nr:hypothetical protein [Pseudomonadota bacterium]